ncbi:MAG TPA: hypothetical protein ENK46_01115 [Flavobacteriia bacterium]|jgi:hypothetical protein|nr:hypothetical protein [Flavobacteriia bacterium]
MSSLKDKIFSNKYLRWLQIFTNWLMQGILHADMSEKIYKIGFTLFFGAIFFSLFYFQFNISIFKSIVLGFIIAHTINWFVNCNFYVLFVHRMRWLKTSKPELFNQLTAIRQRLEKMPDKDWILYSVSHGGICKGTLNKHSDIDVSLIRKPGLKNMVKAILFYVKEKKYADIKGVPLDIFICDSPENCIQRSKRQKNPIVLLDHKNKVDDFYTDKLSMSIEEAKVLNGEKPSKDNN